ncbi:hypothetical protein MMPV_006432 [Pyropia vietnamensis]
MARRPALTLRRSQLALTAVIGVTTVAAFAAPADAFSLAKFFGFLGFHVGGSGSGSGAAATASPSPSALPSATPAVSPPTVAPAQTATPTPSRTDPPTASNVSVPPTPTPFVVPAEKRDFNRASAVSLKSLLKGKVPSAASVVSPAPPTGYLAKLFFFDDGDMFFCLGALLTRRHVLTAAHCATQAGDTVRVGGSSMLDGVQRTIARVVEHPQFAETLLTFEYDAAVLVLDTPISSAEMDANDLVFVRLWAGPDDKPPVASTALVRGFGLLGVGDTVPGVDNALSETLLELTHTVHSDTACEALFGSSNSGGDALISVDDALHVCASASPRGTSCGGDSGAPLVVEKNTFGFWGRIFNAPTEFVSYGVLSFGLKVGNVNCPLDKPTVWTRASVVRPFVERVVTGDGLQLL